MDEATYQRLALQGGPSLVKALDAERTATSDAHGAHRQHLARHRQAAAGWRTDWRPRPKALRLTATPAPPEPANVLSGQVQYLGSVRYVLDVTTAQREQHVDAQPFEVLCLPFETCSWLLAHRPAFWQTLTALPDPLSVTHDGATGLDETFLAAANPWGVTADGRPYFDTSCGLGDSERARLLMGSPDPTLHDLPYLTSDEED